MYFIFFLGGNIMESIGLVLEGGGMRGIYTSGVLEFFLVNNLDFSYVIGVSAGACNAASYISKQKERNKTVMLDYIRNPKYLSFRNIIFEKSIFGMDFIFNEIPNKLNPFDFESFSNSKQKYIIGTTCCSTGKSVYFEKNECKDFLKVLTASSSLPLVAPIVKIDNNEYLDGGIADPIPIRKSINDGNKKNVIILTRNKGFMSKQSRLLKLIKRKYSNYPKLIETIANRYENYNKTISYIESLEKNGDVFVIRPSELLKVNKLEKNVNKLEHLYSLGYKDAENSYKKLIEWINN